MTTLQQSQKFCVFQCGESCFAFPAMAVQSVVPTPPITLTPQSDPILKGICHLHNEFLPVFSLRALTQIQYSQHQSMDHQLLVLLGDQGRWGVLIDQAIGLSELETSIPTFANQQDAFSKVTTGSASFQNQVLQVLDPDALYEYTVQLLGMFWGQDDLLSGTTEEPKENSK